MFKEQLRDVLKHTHGLSFINMVKLAGSSDEVSVTAIDDEKSVVLYGKLKNVFATDGGVTDYTIGLSRMGILNGYLNFPLFDSDEAAITMETIEKNQVTVPSEIKFDSNNGHISTYRFMDQKLADELIMVPPFKGAKWDVVIEPTKQNLAELKYFASILTDPTFTVKTDGTELVFELGSMSESHASVPFAKDITGSLQHAWSYPMAQVLAILKLSDPAICTMHFSDQGALKIVVDSGMGEYEYILPAKSV